jgi:hypothetical protein
MEIVWFSVDENHVSVFKGRKYLEMMLAQLADTNLGTSYFASIAFLI